MQYFSLVCSGKLMEEYELCLSDDPGYWATLYADRYLGQTVELRIEGGREDLLDLVEQSDTPYEDPGAGEEPMRPIVHLSPRHGYMNDPNGLFYFEGVYHFFAQLNPYSVTPGNTHWMHMTSRDLFRWSERPYALLPDDTGLMFSGSGIVDHENRSGFGKDGIPPIFLFFTSAGSKSRRSQGKPFEIGLAVSTDGGDSFEKWPGNPLIGHLTFMNRDPKVVWNADAECWVMVLYLDDDRYQFLYSTDIVHWEPGQTIAISGAAECPDLFSLPLDGDEQQRKWVLWAAADYYIVGYFDGRTFVPETDALHGSTHSLYSPRRSFARSPGGYAAQTFSGAPDGRVIQLSWIAAEPEDATFAGCASIPNELSLVSTPEGPRIRIWPVKEIETVYGERFAFHYRSLEELYWIPSGVCGEVADLSLRFIAGTDHLISFSVRGVLIVYDPRSKLLLLPCGAYDPGPIGDSLELRVIIDRLSMEIYVNGGQFQLSVAGLWDPQNQDVKPVFLDAGTGVSLEVHRLSLRDRPGDRTD